MALGIVYPGYLQNIANAIREVSDSEDKYTPAEMGDAIRAIEYGTEDLEVEENGEYYPSDGNVAFSSVVVEVPEEEEEECELTTKSVTKNGTYKASDDSADGYSQVTVNVKKISGKKSSSSGGDNNDYSVTIDNDNNFVETVLPSNIVITTNPTKLSYEDGETIDKTGMVVKAYKGDGNLWEASGYSGGVVPNSELVLDPNKADRSHAAGDPTSTSSLDTSPISKPIPLYSYAMLERDLGQSYYNRYSKVEFSPSVNCRMIALRNGNSLTILFAGASSGIVGSTLYSSRHSEDDEWSSDVSVAESQNSYTTDNKTVYYSITYGSAESFEEIRTAGLINYTGSLTIEALKRIAWTMIYGTVTNGGQEITVKWDRPEDGKLLTDKFNIQVS